MGSWNKTPKIPSQTVYVNQARSELPKPEPVAAMPDPLGSGVMKQRRQAALSRLDQSGRRRTQLRDILNG